MNDLSGIATSIEPKDEPLGPGDLVGDGPVGFDDSGQKGNQRIDYDKVPDAAHGDVQSAQLQYRRQRASLTERIQTADRAGDFDQAAELRQKRMDLDSEFEEFARDVETADQLDPTFGGPNTIGQSIQEHSQSLGEVRGEAREFLGELQESHQQHEAPPPEPLPEGAGRAIDGLADVLRGERMANEMTGQELLDLQREEPRQFQEGFETLSPQERADVTEKLDDAQQMNALLDSAAEAVQDINNRVKFR